jgi:hypothetical protein
MLKSVGPNKLMSYNPQEIHILKIITMAKMKTNVENSKFNILEVALTFPTKVFTTPKHLNDFNMR